MADRDKQPQDPRVKATGTIWGIACGMMGISTAFMPFMHGDGVIALPIMILLGSFLSTGFVWLGPNRNFSSMSAHQSQELDLVKQTVLELHAHVETLERRLEEQTLQQRINQASSATIQTSGKEARSQEYEAPPIVTSRRETPQS